MGHALVPGRKILQENCLVSHWWREISRCCRESDHDSLDILLVSWSLQWPRHHGSMIHNTLPACNTPPAMGPNCHAVYDVQADTEVNSKPSIMFPMRYELMPKKPSSIEHTTQHSKIFVYGWYYGFVCYKNRETKDSEGRGVAREYHVSPSYDGWW